MTSRDFCYWLQGYFEIHAACYGSLDSGQDGITAKQRECIQNHLALVFKHDIDPQNSGGDAEKHQEYVGIHGGSLYDGLGLGIKINC